MVTYTSIAMLQFFNLLTTEYIGTTPILHVGLAQNNFTPGPGLTLAGLTVATFDGYAGVAATGFTTPVIGPNLQPITNVEPLMSFTPSGAVTSNTIYGYFLYAGSNLLGAELLPAPVLLDGPATNLSFVASLAIGAGTNAAAILP